MQINITGHHMDVTPAIRAFTEEKFDKLERHFDQITSINVVFGIEKLRQIAEATVYIAKGSYMQVQNLMIYTPQLIH